MRTDSRTGTTLPPNALLNAANSLYDDELQPTFGLLRRRLKELYDVFLPMQDFLELVQIFVDAEIMHTKGDAGDLVVMLTSRPSGSLVDPTDPHEPYDPEIFQRMQVMMNAVAVADPHRLYKGGRYGMAQQLRSVEMPELRRFSLGRVCHIVQRAIEKKIVGYKKGGSLVPYQLSDAFLKDTAEGPGVLPVDLPPITTMAELRAALTILWMNPKHHQGLSLSVLKDEIRRSAKRSLSENQLGFGKLSQLLSAPELAGSCDLSHECHDVLLYPPSFANPKELCTERTRARYTPASSRFCSPAHGLEGSCDLSHECHDMLQYPPSFVNAKEVCTERADCALIPSRKSSKRDPTPAATETPSTSASPALTFASSQVSNISAVTTADGLETFEAPVLQVPPLRLQDMFNMPPLLPDETFLPPLKPPILEMLPSGEMPSGEMLSATPLLALAPLLAAALAAVD